MERRKLMSKDNILKSYTVVHCLTVDTLITEVNEHLDEGYELAGPLQIVPDHVMGTDSYGRPIGVREYKNRYYQPMMLTEKV